MLVFFGGMLVIFMYVSSLTPNEMGVGGSWAIVLVVSLIVVGLRGFWLDDEMVMEVVELRLMVRLYTVEMVVGIGFLVLYLLYVLLVVVDVTKVRYGALKLIYDRIEG